jgi:hypothetical protein
MRGAVARRRRRPDSNLDRPLVLNAVMQRMLPRLLLVVLAAALLPATAEAKIIEVGDIGAKFPPSCPAVPCQVVSRTTGYQTRVEAKRKLFVVPKDGKIVAWTVTLGAPRKRDRVFFEDNLGGAARAGITVLKTGTKQYGRVLAQSPQQLLTPYFGQTVQFPLATALDVKAGYVVALTVPTWAPVLSLNGLNKVTAWRASRPAKKCDDTKTQSAQTTIRQLTQYSCLYRAARLTYSATLITTPVPPVVPKPKKPTS